MEQGAEYKRLLSNPDDSFRVEHYQYWSEHSLGDNPSFQRVSVELPPNTNVGDVHRFTYEGKGYDVCLHPKRTLVVGNRPWKVDAHIELPPGKTKSSQPIHITDSAASAMEDSNDTDGDFVAADTFRGALAGYMFKNGDKGLCYYRDTMSTHADSHTTSTRTDSDNTVANALLHMHAQ
jgi:hypothetical protein